MITGSVRIGPSHSIDLIQGGQYDGHTAPLEFVFLSEGGMIQLKGRTAKRKRFSGYRCRP